jgi:hypothetical protein
MFYIDSTIKVNTRFAKEKFINYDNGFDILDSYFINQLTKLPSIGTFRVTTELNRPDIVSYKIYGHVQYWWIIMLFNEIYDELELTYNTVLKYPSLPALEDLYFELTIRSK